jgi:hypothetical protein
MVIVSIIFLSFISVVRCARWPIQLTYSNNPMPDNATLNTMLDRRTINYAENVCLSQTLSPAHSDNDMERFSSAKHNKYKPVLTGTTMWINDWFAPGHVFFIISMIQVMQSIHIDRIILQRAPCWREDFCSGIGYYRSFYQGFYRVLIHAFQPQTTLYIRWYGSDKEYHAINLTDIRKNQIVGTIDSRFPPIKVQETTCFEKVVARIVCHTCMFHSVSNSAIQQFKQMAYQIVSQELQKPLFPSMFSTKDPIIITFAYRSENATRKMDNLTHVISIFQHHLQGKNITYHLPTKSIPSTIQFETLDTSQNNLTYTEQINIVTRTQILIAEHGAFQAHLMYLRNASLLIDLRANSKSSQYQQMFELFEAMTHLFGIFHASVTMRELKLHEQKEYRVHGDEIQQIIHIIHEYLQEQPFVYNLCC